MIDKKFIRQRHLSLEVGQELGKRVRKISGEIKVRKLIEINFEVKIEPHSSW